MTQEEYVSDAVDLLKKLIATPSVSRNEKDAADIMEQTIRKYGFEPHREANNIWMIDPHYDESRPTLLLNAHIDTVKPVASWTRNPFSPDVEEGVLYGLGSNDCGGGLCSLLQIFRMLTAKPQQYNLIYLASAEEEVSGKDGITRALPLLPHIDLAIVGEPTGMNPAVAEKGLMVLDVIAHGKSGHAARNEGVNAIYEALDDMRWIRDYKFEKVSEFLGPTKMTLTVVNAGTQHNVVMYLAAIVYLSASTIVTAREFQNRSRVLIYPLMLFLTIETIIQVALPSLHVTWLCVTLLSVLYFIYCSEMWNQLDALTGLLNQDSYLNRTAEMRRSGGVLVVFDVDDFKQVNDRYGHLQGDVCLAEIADCIKKAYARCGYCYRIGGDEFCVLLRDAADEARCAAALQSLLAERRKEITLLPTLSLGSAVFSGEDVVTVKDRADRALYCAKNELKARAAAAMPAGGSGEKD